MNNLTSIPRYLSWLILAVVFLASGLAPTTQAEIENVTVERGSNRSFILCQPKVSSASALSEYIETAHGRLATALPSLTTEAVVTFVEPISIDDAGQFIDGLDVANVSIRSLSERFGELIIALPVSEDEFDSTSVDYSARNVVSMRLTSVVPSLVALTLDSNVLCVDAGALDQMRQHPDAMIIVLEDLYEAKMSLGSAAKVTEGNLPDSYSLQQNFPNPFNPVTEISFGLPLSSDVKLEIFNLLGQNVTVLHEGYLEAGVHSLSWDGSDVASGVYLYKLTAGNFSETKKMVLLK